MMSTTFNWMRRSGYLRGKNNNNNNDNNNYNDDHHLQLGEKERVLEDPLDWLDQVRLQGSGVLRRLLLSLSLLFL